MNFENLIDDIEKLVGKRLASIKAGSEITITAVNKEAQSITLINSKGSIQSRPFSQFRILWSALSKQPFVHVESALNGSGSSRNQPETILANLPYIEWVRVDGKKKISYVGKETHAYATLKEMSQLDLARIQSSLKQEASAGTLKTLYVTDDLSRTCDKLHSVLGCDIDPIESGLYKWQLGEDVFLIASEAYSDLTKGTYTFIDSLTTLSAVDGFIKINEHEYMYININGLRCLIEKE